MARCPSDDTDVFGPTMSRHSTLAAARHWRTRYYQSCLAQQVTPAPLVIVEVRHNCLVRYVGRRAIAIYREGYDCRTEDLRREMRFTVESVLGTPSVPSSEAQTFNPKSLAAPEAGKTRGDSSRKSQGS